MRLSRRCYGSLLAIAAAMSAVGFFIVQRSGPDLLRCNPSLSGTEYYHVRFGIDYATRLDRLFSQRGLFENSDMTGQLKGSFLIEWPGKPGVGQSGTFTVRAVDFALNETDASTASGDAIPPVELDLRLDDSCRLSVLPGVNESSDAGNLVIRVMSLLTFSVPERRLTVWEAEHEDDVGVYRASYRLDLPEPDRQVIFREKDAYLHVSDANQAQHLEPKVIHSSSVGRFSPGARWLHSLEGIDDVSLLHEGRAVVQTRVSYSVQKKEDGFVWRPRDERVTDLMGARNGSQVDDDEARSDDDVARFADKADAGGFLTSKVPGPETMEILSEASLAQLGIPAVLALVVEALKASPALAYSLRDAIYAGTLDRNGAPLAFLALQQAGTEQALRVLSEMIESDAATQITRSRAVYALAGTKPDSMVVAQILAGQLARAGSDQTLTQQSALLAMGMMVDLIEGEHDPTKGLLRQLIGEHLARAQDDDARRTALAAAYNAADPALYPLVVPHLKDSSPSIRTLAVEAIAKSAAPDSRSELMRHYSKEGDSAVKVATLDALAALSRNAGTDDQDYAGISWIAAGLQSEADPQVRGAIVRFLGAHADHGEARSALAAQVATEKDPALLKQLGAVLTPEDLARLRRNP